MYNQIETFYDIAEEELDEFEEEDILPGDMPVYTL